MAAEFSSDVGRRAAPVSPSSQTQGKRPPNKPQGRFRPRLPGRPAQQWPVDGCAVGGERSAVEPIRLRDLQARGYRRCTEQGEAPTTRTLTFTSNHGGLRRRDQRASGSGRGDIPGPREGTDAFANEITPPRNPSFVARLVMLLIRGYQKGISPGLGNLCRFEPSCSHYAYEAVERHGAIRGVWLGARRLGRCRPFGPTGYDPVPD